jgi:hypothetical protein
VDNFSARCLPQPVAIVNPCAIQSAQPSVPYRIRGERMLDGKKYFESFPDEAPDYLAHDKDEKNPPGLTAELLAALEELKKYFQNFLGAVADK